MCGRIAGGFNHKFLRGTRRVAGRSARGEATSQVEYLLCVTDQFWRRRQWQRRSPCRRRLLLNTADTGDTTAAIGVTMADGAVPRSAASQRARCWAARLPHPVTTHPVTTMTTPATTPRTRTSMRVPA